MKALARILEHKFQKRYHAASVVINKDQVTIGYFDSCAEESVVVSLGKAILGYCGDGIPMPANWKQIADSWIFRDFTMSQVEEHLHCSVVDIPEEFFLYANAIEEDYSQYCADNAEDYDYSN